MEGNLHRWIDDLRAKTASPLDVLRSKTPLRRESASEDHRFMADQLRISNSPRRSPQVTEALTSPARSVYASMQQMDSVYNQPDSGMRTTDFFDESSDDDSAREVAVHDATGDGNNLEHRRVKSKKRRADLPDEPLPSQCEGKGLEMREQDDIGYQPLSPSMLREDTAINQRSSSSLAGSVDELLPGGSSPPPFISQNTNPGGDSVKHSTPNKPHPTHRSSKFDHTLGVYAIAHDITLQALMRNEEAQDSTYPRAQLQSSDRGSFLQQSLRQDSVPRSPRTRHVSSPPTAGKKVHVTLPPIDTTASRRSLPAGFIPTPFPFSPEPARHKHANGDATPPSRRHTTTNIESILTISIRRNNPSSKRRTTNLTIPASNDFSAIRSRSPRTKEQHFKALDFDDAAFFQRLRDCYRQLIGPWHFFSARSLQRIVVSGPAMKQADREYWVHPPRSPGMFAYNGLKDVFSQEKILQHYRKPALGKSRFAFVHWAHRLAAAPPLLTPGSEETGYGNLVQNGEQPEGLEFVVSWSIPRIAIAFILVVVVVLAATFLWIFLGLSTSANYPPHGGFRDAGDRVTAGVVMGICLLVLGLSGIAGWLGISWLAM